MQNCGEGTRKNEQENITSINNNKEKYKKKKEYKNYGEYKNVFFTEEQYEKLIEMFPKDHEERIQKLDDYMQSSGKKYKDCLATLRNWARKEGYKFQEEKREYKELSEDEYLKKVKGGDKRYV